MSAQNLWRWENPSNGRYYEVAITQDMFGQWTVIKLHGGLSGQFRYQSIYVDSKDEAHSLVNKISAKRKQRGYQPV